MARGADRAGETGRRAELPRSADPQGPRLTLESLGFDAFFAAQAERADRPDLVPARVIADGKAELWIAGSQAKLGNLTGKLRNDKRARPVVGDWVLVRDGAERATIHALLDRRTVLARKAAGRKVEAQVIAANLDVVFIVTSANDDLNLRRLERYLAAVREGGARPVIVLNKSDLLTADDSARALAADVPAIANGATILETSALTSQGVDAIAGEVGAGKTAALVGSSGVGKSSLLNRLVGRDAQTTADLIGRERGRHTTTRRELFILPGGGILVDTPGMRELGIIDAESGLTATFADVVALAEHCRFRDCAHAGDLGCAVQAAVDDGTLARERFEAYQALQRELAAHERRKKR